MNENLQTILDLTAIHRTRNEHDLRRVLFAIYQDPPDFSRHQPAFLDVEEFRIPLIYQRAAAGNDCPRLRFRFVSPNPEWMTSDLRWFIAFIGCMLDREQYVVDSHFERIIALPVERIRQIFEDPSTLYLGHWYMSGMRDELPPLGDWKIRLKCRPRSDLRVLELGEKMMHFRSYRNREEDNRHALPWEFEDGQVTLDPPAYGEPDASKHHRMPYASHYHFYIQKYAEFFGLDILLLRWSNCVGNYVVDPYEAFDFASITDYRDPNNVIFVNVMPNGTLQKIL